MKRNHKQNRIFTLNNPLSPRICPDLATEIGLNESILFLQFEYWIATEGEERDGHVWIRKTVREVRKDFCFWSIGTVGNIIQELVTKGYMVKGKYDDAPGKNGRWLRFDFDRLSALKSIRVICPESEQPLSRKSTDLSNSRTTVLIEEEKKIIKRSHRDPVLPPPEPDVLPPYFGAEFIRALDSFECHRIEMKKPLKPTGRKALYDKLTVWGERKATEALVDATANGWTGVFEPKSQNGSNGNGHKKSDDDRPIWMASKK